MKTKAWEPLAQSRQAKNGTDDDDGDDFSWGQESSPVVPLRPVLTWHVAGAQGTDQSPLLS
jgi:hypothetical protein